MATVSAHLSALVHARFFALTVLFTGCVLTGLGLTGCGSTADRMPTCNSQNCQGCCLATGQCMTGNTKASCGKSGNACSVCGETDFCIAGVCTANTCRYVNADCTADGQCCAGLVCTAQRCVAERTCKEGGAVCSTNDDCCSSQCNQGTCLDTSNCNAAGGSCSPCCQSGLSCVNGTCQLMAGTCMGMGDSCTVQNPCCGNLSCVNGTCQ